jgi:hypothetical protein
LIFPLDVQKSAAQASKLVGREKTKLIVFGTIFVNVAVALLTVPFFSSVGISAWFPITIQLLIMATLGWFIFRFFVFKESEKLRERKGYSSDSFSKFFFFRNLDSGENLDVPKFDVPVYEYDNGSAVFVLRLRFGSNDTPKSINTRNALTEIFRILAKENLEFRQIVTPEDFSQSPEARAYMAKVSAIPNKKLAKRMLDITQAALEHSAAMSNTDMIHILVRTKSNYQKYELDSIVRKVLGCLFTNRTAFRSVDFLNKKALVDFLRDFYGLEGIDLALMRIKSREEMDSDYKNIVEIHQLIASNGKALTNKEAIEKAIVSVRPIKF